MYRSDTLYSQYIRSDIICILSMHHSDTLCIFIMYRSDTPSYIFSVYPTDTTRSRTQCSTLILQPVLIQIRSYMYSSMCIVQLQLALELACPINDTSVCINTDTTQVFFYSVSYIYK